ncbi:hypothetical protein AD006_31525 (plasmid) [Pseudonocardia sp. EC080610-09]|uniref:hypothetical protein n=1 Tax=unclassified Pseudonocardia TaxID=2619320 RepID=UPI000705AA3A|nr:MULTISPECIES: hypothetical protein [unclassified Pseudonocardia]ALL79689.1 hypothetical protein AD006_31525 [Pseudonocardia sp. EC080610-09]ALL85357.1 hypothetical protein AD017_29725 [Pseudonocardia sp. EC080619-01]
MPVRFLPPRSDHNGPSPEPEPGRIAVADIEELVAAGEAIALMPEFDVGPTWYRDMWWIVPTGEWDRGFAVASEQDQAEFSRMFLKLHRSQQLVSERLHWQEKLSDPDALTDDERAALREADRIADRSLREQGRGRFARWKRRSGR